MPAASMIRHYLIGDWEMLGHDTSLWWGRRTIAL
jgi:hypothetical protein